MRRVVVTGIGAVTAAGPGADALREALRRGEPLARPETILLPGGARRLTHVARLSGFDPAEVLSAASLRKMSPESRLVTATCLMASRHASAEARAVPPERRATYLGSGFGCLETTQAYLDGVFREGMAAGSPFLFAESLTSAPLGHVAIALDARGPSMAFLGGDAAGLVALGEACRAIRTERADRAICASFECMPGILVEQLTRLAGRAARRGGVTVGEGAVALVLEDLGFARASGATIHAEILGVGSAGDPSARSNGWSEDDGVWADAHTRALRQAARHKAGGARPISLIFRHAPPSGAAAAAETRALDRLDGATRGAARLSAHHVFGSYAAAGGLSLAAAALAASDTDGLVLVSAGAWGGGTAAAVMGARGA